MNEKKLLIFDVDGTIWNSELDIFHSFNHVLESNYGIKIDKGKFSEMAGFPLDKMFAYIIPGKNQEIYQSLENEYKKYYIDGEHFADNTVLYDNVKETLSYLHRSKYTLAIASTKPNRILEKMVDKFSLNYFSLILGTEESNIPHKPDPSIINIILNKLFCTTERAFIIGDSPSDIKCGKNAKINTIAVTYGFGKKEKLLELKPNYLINDFIELKGIF